ncbi:hypothetical protein Krac_6395 [Ktedonobacter racemifer DSM 44963]|uniref:Uncharacterized protein n=2 Tax=Ktedonobacter racemifer TaxID=363277 RepID=D6TUC3_KTERA|nr:hypothetical protein Krac_6395 [Ktedonobacter racemifer DSM 44963]
MIIRCSHLHEIGVLKHPCCFHCHGPAGCVMTTLPGGHQAIYCCARTTPLTPEEVETILANIPRWEALLVNPKYHRRLRQEYEKAQTRLRLLEDLMLDAQVELEQADTSALQIHLSVDQSLSKESTE